MMKTVHVIFIRHCESEENVKVQHLNEALHRVCNWRSPTWEQCSNSLCLASIDTDSKLTDLGRRQIEDMTLTLQEVDFWSNFSFDVCVYSPSKRARDTCFGLIPEHLRHKSQPLELLREIEIYEHAIPSILKFRIAQLERWIIDQDKKTIVMVGHSRYFHKLLSDCTNSYMWNCDIWQTAFVYDPTVVAAGKSSRVGIWHEPTLLFRSPLAKSHPIEGIFSVLFKRVPSDNNPSSISRHGKKDAESRRKERERMRQEALRQQTNAALASGDTFYEEPICRICQAKQSEMPELKLIRPCKCAGSLAYVHLDCLNQWRATSETAFAQCSVCQISYRIRKSLWAEWLLNPTVLIFLCVGLIGIVATLVGLCAVILADQCVPSYNSHLITEYLGMYVQLSTKQCSHPKEFMALLQKSLPPMNRLKKMAEQAWIIVGCNFWLSLVIRSVTLGLLIVAMVTHVYQYYQLFVLRRDWMEGGGHRQLPGLMGVVSIWVSNDLRYSLRLCTVFGLVLAVSRLYSEASTQIRKYSHEYLGNVVLDIDDDE